MNYIIGHGQLAAITWLKCTDWDRTCVLIVELYYNRPTICFDSIQITKTMAKNGIQSLNIHECLPYMDENGESSMSKISKYRFYISYRNAKLNFEVGTPGK